MHKLTFGLFSMFIMLVACNSKQNNENTTAPATKDEKAAVTTTPVTSPTTSVAATWIDDFRTLRDAIYNKQKETVAGYFSFPITKNSEGIWALCNVEGDMTGRSFTKEDFMRNFDRIFDSEFVATLQKVKSEELYKTGTNTTPLIKGKDVTSSMTATFNKKENSLRLALGQEFYQEEGTGGESDTMFEFDIKDNKLKFKQVQIAG
jgi:hypothetical protein